MNTTLSQLLKYKPYVDNRAFWRKDRERIVEENFAIAAAEYAMETVYGGKALPLWCAEDRPKHTLEAYRAWQGIYAALVYPVPSCATPFAE